MIYLKFNSEGRNIYQHNKPFDSKYGLNETEEQLRKEGLLVEQLPERLPVKEGTTQVLYYIDRELQWRYEKVTIPDLIDEQIDETQETTINQLGKEIAQLKLDNIQKNNIINTLGQELANVKLQLLQIQGQGGE